MRKIHFIMLLVFLVSCASSTNGQNIAIGKKYTFSEKPNYALTEGTDDLDLTDGKKKIGLRFWQDKSTVGWGYSQEVVIELDLESTHEINGILINTARGQGAEVDFPMNCLVFTSRDNNEFEYHGDLMLSEANSSGDYKVGSFHLEGVETEGRYVKIVLTTNGTFLFLDEIEVYGSKVNNVKRPNKQLISKSDFEAFVIYAKNESAKIRNQKKDVQALNSYLGDFGSSTKISGTKENINDIIKNIQNNVLPREVVFTPISSTSILNNFNLDIVIANQKESSKNSILGQERGLHYFSLINNKSKRESITFKPTNGLNYNIYEVLPVVGQKETYKKDALKLIKNNLVNIEPGENKYFVIQVFQGINGDGFKIFSFEEEDLIGEFKIDSKVDIANQDEKLEVNLWAYLDKPVLKDNIEFAVNDLDNAGVDVIVVHSGFIDGYNTKDFSKLKRYLKNFTNLQEKKIFIFYNFDINSHKRFNGKTILDRTWKNNFAKWYRLLQNELTKIGVNKNNIYFYPYDEISPDELNSFIELVKWGKASIPGFKTFVTINDKRSYGAGRYADIAQIPKTHLGRIDEINNNNIWTYTADNRSRDLSPYADYRLMSWYAYYYGLQGVGFWNYCALPSENDAYYNKTVNGNREYSVIYLDESGGVLPSLRWLCFQQGLDDWKMLKAYESIIGKDRVRRIVESVIENPKDATKADEALKILSGTM